ncbi:MAG TPA: hypothetical protein PKA64_02785 [Myxococcota bacterium]|nr:hypothetical protein [Myxococcota bacterium]
MILPTKGIDPDRALLALGADVLRLLDEPKTISRVWEELAEAHADPQRSTLTFDWFVLSLDVLFALGIVSLERGRLTPAPQGAPRAGDVREAAP